MKKTSNKKFYQRRRFWVLILFLGLVSAIITPFIINPIKSFRTAVLMSLKLWGIQEKSIQAGNLKIRYYEGGTENKQKLLLIHGFGGNALFTWMRLLPALSQDYHVYAPDLLASNIFKIRSRNYSVAKEVHLVKKFMDAVQIDQADLIGLSVGGWISLSIAQQYPDRVNRLILVESAGVRTEVPELAQLILTDRQSAKRFLNLLFYDPPPLPGFVLDQMVQSSQKIKKKYLAVFSAFIKNSEAYLMDEKLGEIEKPTLIIHGREDRVIPLKAAVKINQGLPNSSLLVLEETGHAVVWDAHGPLKKAILDFLKIKYL